MPDLFGRITANHEVIYPRYDPATFVGRKWLVKEVVSFRDNPDSRQLIIVGEPGSGKSAFVAYLAEAWNCPRHFIRVDSVRGVTGISPRNFLVSIGEQLYQKYGPAVFGGEETQKTKLTVGLAIDKAEVVGRFIDELYTLPFLPKKEREIQVKVGAATGQARVIGERVKKLIDVTLALDETTLLHVAVLHPLQSIGRLFPDEIVVILVDALDESLQHPGNGIVDIIPSASDSTYPANLRLVMTSRRGDHLVRFRSQDLLYLDDEKKGYWEENRKDTEAYVLKQLRKPPLEQILRNWSEEETNSYITTIRDSSDGNFLFLYHFFNELFDAVAKGETDIKNIRVPKGLDEIYRYFAVDRIRNRILDSISFTASHSISEELISQWRTLPNIKRIQIDGQEVTLEMLDINLVLGPLFALNTTSGVQIANLRVYQGAGGEAWETSYLPILGILAVAYEPLSREQLAAYAKVDVAFVDRLVAHMVQFLDQIIIDGQSRHRIYHSSFSDYLLDNDRNRDYPLDGRALHSGIADHFLNGYGDWRNVNWSLVEEDYPYQYLPLHLLAAKRKEEFYTLINQGWMEAKLVRSYSSQAFSEDLTRAIQVAEQDVDFAQVIRLSLIQVTLRSMANAVPADLIGSLAYVDSKRADAMAKGNAELILGKEKQVIAYHQLGAAFLNRKNQEQAEVNLMTAVKITKEISSEYQKADLIWRLANTIIELTNDNPLQELIKTALTMSDGDAKAIALSNLAGVLADKGKRDYAFDLAGKALTLTQSLPDQSSCHRLYAAIAVVFDHLQDTAKAEELANLSLSSVQSHPTTLNQVTHILLDMTTPHMALQAINRTQAVLETFPEGKVRLESRSVLAKYMARIGASDGATSNAQIVLDTIASYEMGGYESYALSEIAQAFAILGKKDKALAIAKEALAACESIDRLDPKMDALILGNIPAAVTLQNQQLLTEVLEIIGQSIQSPRWEISEVSSFYDAVCRALAQLGSIDGLNRALQIANELKNKWKRIAACGRVAQYLIQVGEKDQALEVADRIFVVAQELFGAEMDKVLCQGALAMTYAQYCAREKLPSLIDEAATLDTSYKTALLAIIASRLDQQQEERQVNHLIDDVAKSIDSFRDVSVRVTPSLIGIFRALVRLGRQQELTRLVNKLESQNGNTDIPEFILKVVRFAITSSDSSELLSLRTEILDRLVQQRQIEFEGSSGRWDKWERGPLLHVILQKLLELGDSDQVSGLVQQSVADSDANLSPYNKAAVLSKAAISLSVAGRQEKAESKLLNAISVGREWSRNTVFRAVEHNADTLGKIDQGETLWKTFEFIQEVDSWWKSKAPAF